MKNIQQKDVFPSTGFELKSVTGAYYQQHTKLNLNVSILIKQHFHTLRDLCN